jgi:ribonuclease III
VSSLRQWIQKIFRTTPEQSFSELYSKIDLVQFQHALRYRIRNRDLFLQAMLHRSYTQFVNSPDVQSNERLEFLGDSVLNMVAAEHLYSAYPRADEGRLTVLRARLVNRKALVSYARQIHLRDFLLLSNSASQAAEKGSETIVADAYEAVIGAIYLDGGLEEARQFVHRQLVSAVEGGLLDEADENYKSALLEYAQANGKAIPRYIILKEDGPDHDRTFTVEATIGNGLSGVGTGKNKKEAEQAAAENALMQINEKQAASNQNAAH